MPDRQIIGVGGYARAGKDTVGQYLVERHGFTRMSFGDGVRQIAYALDPYVETDTRFDPIGYSRLTDLVDDLGWEKAKSRYPDVRRLLQRLGTEAGRDILGTDIWVEILNRQMTADKVVITDCRFPNEVAYVRNNAGSLWWIERPGVQAVNAHASETSVSYRDFDYTIFNGDTVEILHDLIDIHLVAAGLAA